MATPGAAPSEADVVRWSHNVLDAYDRGDGSALDAALGPGFVHFEGGAVTEREAELARVAKRKPSAPHITSRAWSVEHVYVRPDHALFIGQAKEHMGGNDSHGGSDFDGWYTLQWHRDGGAWKLAFWSWQKAGVGAARDTWNEIYRSSRGFSHEPNRLLAGAIEGVRPGTALDLAMGQGRNALFLAARGWKVTGVDFSDEGIRIARAAAAEKNLTLEALNVDFDTWDFGTARWDLVTMIYALDKVAWIEKAKRSLKPGGLFVLEYFHRDGPSGDGFAAGQLAAFFEQGFEILRDDVVDDTPDWTMDHATLVRFVAKKR
jgi:SAM-dependent methyltransferase